MAFKSPRRSGLEIGLEMSDKNRITCLLEQTSRLLLVTVALCG